jgi:hypothetical protein
MSIEESGDLFKCLSRLRRVEQEQILGVRHGLENLEPGFYPGLTELPVHPHRVALEKITGTCGENGRWKSTEIPVQRRDEGVLQVMFARIELNTPP